MSLRAAQEKAWIEGWLTLVEQTLQKDPAAAREVVETAQLVRGYGDTWARGHANWRRIAEEVIAPMLGGGRNAAHFADAVLQARLAAVADPEGKRLDAMIASFKKAAARVAAGTTRFDLVIVKAALAVGCDAAAELRGAQKGLGLQRM
jgi:indolepyruvate ferredoxin oxidoreductase beta subunit